MAAGIIYDGYPSMDEIKEANGWPDESVSQKARWQW